jgi:hypothetical protein
VQGAARLSVLAEEAGSGSAEHRNMIFRETFGHFADLIMTGMLYCSSIFSFDDSIHS